MCLTCVLKCNFVCVAQGDQLAKPGAAKAFRTQLPRHNRYYSSDPPTAKDRGPQPLSVSSLAPVLQRNSVVCAVWSWLFVSFAERLMRPPQAEDAAETVPDRWRTAEAEAAAASRSQPPGSLHLLGRCLKWCSTQNLQQVQCCSKTALGTAPSAAYTTTCRSLTVIIPQSCSSAGRAPVSRVGAGGGARGGLRR